MTPEIQPTCPDCREPTVKVAEKRVTELYFCTKCGHTFAVKKGPTRPQ